MAARFALLSLAAFALLEGLADPSGGPSADPSGGPSADGGPVAVLSLASFQTMRVQVHGNDHGYPEILWEIRRDSESDGRAQVELSGPGAAWLQDAGLLPEAVVPMDADMPASPVLNPETAGVLHLYYGGRTSTTVRPDPSTTTSADSQRFQSASASWRACALLPVSLGATGLAMGLAPRHLIPAVGLMLVHVAAQDVSPAENSMYGGPLTLTLVVQDDGQMSQWAEVAGCRDCTGEIPVEHKHFAWRAPCDISAAAGALDAMAAAGCDAQNVCGQTSMCHYEHGWCEFPNPPGQCASEPEVSGRCFHESLRTQILGYGAVQGGAATEQLAAAAFQCWYPVPVEGRPHPSLAPPGPARRLLRDWTGAMSSLAAAAWLQHGQDEHGSVASFSRLSMDLLRFGAPPRLLLATHAAATDEVRHAQLAFGLAAQFGSGEAASSVEVDGFPVDSVKLSASLSELASLTVAEGCFGEGAATASLEFALAVVEADSPTRALIEMLVSDEARHSALAWSTARWAVGRGADLGQRRAPRSALLPRADDTPDAMLTWAGRVPPGISAEISALTERAWVGPWLEGLRHGRTELPPVEAPPGPIGDAVSRAAGRVRALLETAELVTV